MRENEVVDDCETSPWLRDALRATLACDPVRAANDVELLRTLLHRRVARLGAEVRFPAEWVSAA